MSRSVRIASDAVKMPVRVAFFVTTTASQRCSVMTSSTSTSGRSSATASDRKHHVADRAEPIDRPREVALRHHPDQRSVVEHRQVVDLALGDHPQRERDRVIDLNRPGLPRHQVAHAGPAMHHDLDCATPTWTLRDFDAVVSGATIVSTPSYRLLVTCSRSTLSGSVNVRVNSPN